jgi:hypothetical protein
MQYEEVDVHRALPPIPPVSIQEEHTEQINVTWTARQYDDTETHRALPPTPPVSIEDDAERQKNVTWSAIQYEDTETQRALPPTPPFAIVDEISERPLPGVVPFVEEDQPGVPIVAAPVPKMGLDDIEAHIKAYDRVNVYDHTSETDEPGGLASPPTVAQDDDPQRWTAWSATSYDHTSETDEPGGLDSPPVVIQDEISDRWAGTFAVQIEEDQSAVPIITQPIPVSIEDDLGQRFSGVAAPVIEEDSRSLPPAPPFVVQDEVSERFLPGIVFTADDDQPGVPIITSLPPPSVEDDMGQRWSATLLPVTDDDWYASAPLPPYAHEDDLKTFSSDSRAGSIEEEITGKPPLPPIILTASDDEASQIYVDWSLGYARFGAAMDEYDSHILPPIVPGPFVGWRAGLRAFPQFAGSLRTYPQLSSGKIRVIAVN